jgi:hypothetical protein
MSGHADRAEAGGNEGQPNALRWVDAAPVARGQGHNHIRLTS